MENVPTAPEFLPHFEGLASQEIRFPRCTDCGHFHWYPMPACPQCQSQSVQWHAVRGEAKLYSWTEVRHPFHPSLRAEVPYTVALVTFDDAPGVRLVTNLLVVEAGGVHCDMALKPVFDTKSAGTPKVRFRPA